MTEKGEFRQNQFQEKFIRSYGVHEVRVEDGTKNVVMVSAPDWETFAQSLRCLDQGNSIVVGPELITETGTENSPTAEATTLIQKRIEWVKEVSTFYQNTNFLIGTPYATVAEEKPKNAVLIIKNGEIVGKTFKRCGATQDEEEVYKMCPEQEPTRIGGTNIGIVICAELPTMVMRDPVFIRDEILRYFGKASLIGKKINFIDPEISTLIVPCCWSVSMSPRDFENSDHANMYYQNTMKNTAKDIFKKYPSISELVIVDRLPKTADPTIPAATLPFNAHFKRV